MIVQLRVKIIEVHGPREDAFYVDKNDAVNDDKGSCTYYVITDRGGGSPNDYSIT